MAEAPDDLAQAPDYITPVEGWRLWLVVAEAGALRLASIVFEDLWPPGEPLVARCQCLRWRRRPGRACGHAVPDPPCHCGIYAAGDPLRLAFYLEGRYPGRGEVGRVVGRVALWGRVVECERGWRASHAYPVHLYVARRPARCGGSAPEAIADGLGGYRVPIEVLPRAATFPLLGGLGAAARPIQRSRTLPHDHVAVDTLPTDPHEPTGP